VGGEVVGVVCHEHVAEPRRWSADELAFGAEVADQAAQALIQRERKRNEAALRRGERMYRKLNEELERRVADRTEELGRVNAELRRLTSDLLLAEERERRSLAVDLHDGPNQLLVLAQMKLGALRQASGAELRAAIEEIEDLVERANTSSRTLTFQLSPPVLHDLGLAAAVQWLVEDLQRTYGIAIALEEDGRVRDTGERTRVILFRALRELLVNVGKHAHASRVRVRLRRDGKLVRITVEDDGRGFDVERVAHGRFGLPSIRERLRHLGGEMHVHSKLGKGTRIELAAPLDPTGRDGEEEPE
jgi:signal transduction histidine kinase